MEIKFHDSFGHIRETVESAATPHGHAYESRLLRHLAQKANGSDVHEAVSSALTGADEIAVRLATEQNEATGAMAHHDPGILAMLAQVCGGVDPQVAVALLPWFGDESSIEGEDLSGLAWRDGALVLDPSDGQGLHYISDGRVLVWLEFPETVCTAAAGRRFGDVVGLPLPVGARIIAEMSCEGGETEIRLAA